MTVLVTGATGFVGSHVVRQLVREGEDVQVVVRQGSDTTRIADVLQQVDVLTADLTDPGGLAVALDAARPADVCLHLAWTVDKGSNQTSLSNVEMLAGSLRLARQLAARGCSRLVVAGSVFEYDMTQGELSETSRTDARSIYSATKLALLMVLGPLAEATGMSLAWPRLFFLYGPHEDPRRLVPSLCRSLLQGEPAALTPGEQVRDFLHVEDAAAALLAVARSQVTGVVNVSSGAPVPVLHVARVLAGRLGREDLLQVGALPYRDGEPMLVHARPQRLVQATGWRPTRSLEQGLADALAWWSDQDSRTRGVR